MTLNLVAILSLLVAFQLSFMAVYLFTHKKGNKQNNGLLGFLFLMFAINMLDFAARISGFIFPIPLLHLLDDCFFLLYGPVLYFYTQRVAFRDFTFKKEHVWHLIPGVLVIAYLSLQILSIDQVTQTEVTQKIVAADLPIWVPMLGLGVYVHILVYLIFSWRTINTYQAALKEKFSTVDEINLDWLNFMIRAFFIITIVAMVNGILPAFGNVIFLQSSVVVLLIISFYFINRVLVKALNQPILFSGIAKSETEKYAASNLDPEELENFKHQLTSLMETERPYLNADLKSKELADNLGITPKTLSQVINQGFQQNFFDFINSYRCEEVKRVLKGPDKKITVIEAMYQSGFNSKSSFNKEFKKLTGQTPKEFKQSLTEA